MMDTVLIILFFLALGIGWRFLTPHGISADSLQRQLMALVQAIFLPLGIFFIMVKLPMDMAAWRIFLYTLATTAVSLVIAWFWLWKSSLAPKTKGALLIASGFGSVFFLGLPLNNMFVAGWSMRVAVAYGLIANVILLFTAGAVLSRSLAEAGKPKFKRSIEAVVKNHRVWVREPLVWAALAGLLLNLTEMKVPLWLAKIEPTVFGMLIPLLLLSTALALKWNPAWKAQLSAVLPVVVIQLIVMPLVMWGMLSLFGSAGLKTSRALLLESMLPATLLGFAVCDRYKLDTSTYGLAFSLTTVVAMVTVPIWIKIIL